MTLLVTAFAIATALVIGLHIWALNRSAAEVEELGQLLAFEDQEQHPHPPGDRRKG